ncbi:MAG: CIA30 family protein [bacterium]
MRSIAVVFAAALILALAPSLAHCDDPFGGWTRQQLEVKIVQLQSQNAELRAQASSVASVPVPPPKASADLLLDDFETPLASNGRSWWAGCDSNSLGTTLAPQPFVAQAGGGPLSPGHCGRIHGHLGRSQAPWSWAQMTLPLASPDIRGYSALSFYVRGDGGHYRVQLCRATVKDFAFPEAGFDAPRNWTKVSLPLSSFEQPSWGKSVGGDLSDVEKINFTPTSADQDYDLSIDDLTLVK